MINECTPLHRASTVIELTFEYEGKDIRILSYDDDIPIKLRKDVVMIIVN